MSRSLSSSPYIVGRGYDWSLIIGTPLFALVLGITVSILDLDDATWGGAPAADAILPGLTGALIHAHLVIVFFRSHANKGIRRLHPYRFLWVPPILLTSMLLSDWVAVGASVLATFWDVYHSGLQTFGLGRIYEARAGNNPNAGRRLDIILNHLLYAGPIVAGASMLDHFEDFDEFEDIGVQFFSTVPAFMESNQRYFAWVLLWGGLAFLVYYVVAYLRMARNGYNVSWPKVALLVGTGACSIYTWGFNSWGEAFFIMNLFHAVQYFAIVWWKERGTLQAQLSRLRLPASPRAALLLLLASGAVYGAIIEFEPFGALLIYEVSLVVSLMHFWYDGFVWSVRRQQV